MKTFLAILLVAGLTTALAARTVAAAPAMAFARSVKVEYRAGPTGPTVAVGDFAMVTVSVKPVDEKGVAVAGGGVELSGLVTRVSLRK